ncbi:Chaperone protein DnaJ [Lachnellula occidentalis]|uniref:Chaperone protein DnaJ n=1 Tax=Lachnellula occidentalis TaxID=215460 RepID=A0A8H8S3W4_9HELO|nr:Chaperone protein DnaJ [Lachnellula occidentalis]
MAPIAISDDYYMILEVAPTATPETITKSYRRLALLRHPDKNPSRDATKAFQLLVTGYEILRDERKRRAYDCIYPQIAKTAPKPSTSKSKTRRTTPQTPPNPPPNPFPKPGPTPSTSKPKTRPTTPLQTPPNPFANPSSKPDATPFPPKAKNEPSSEARDLSALTAISIMKRERASRFAKSQKEHDDAILTITKHIHKLQTSIRDLDTRRKAEEAEELDAAVKSWPAWSPFGKKPAAETEAGKQLKMKERIDRLHTRTFKERSLQKKQVELSEKKKVSVSNRVRFNAANTRDDELKQEVEERIGLRRLRQKEKRERELKAAEAGEKAEREEKAKARAKEEAREKSKSGAKGEAREKTKAGAKEEASEKSNNEQTPKDDADAKKQPKPRKNSSKPKPPDHSAGKENTNTNHSSAAASASRSARGLCPHAGRWLKMEGQIACGYCFNTYNYLLQCPDCKIDACSACQQTLRPW